MPGFNEEEAIAQSLRALLAVDYPQDKLELIAVNDGSTDSTLEQMQMVAAEAARAGARDRLPREPRQAGRDGGRDPRQHAPRWWPSWTPTRWSSPTRCASSSSRSPTPAWAPSAATPTCSTCGDTWLTRMQAVRYFVAFRVVKAAESVFSAVTCCSGCFSAYRREAIMPRMDWWENQRFLGVESTFGDDRSLTNCVLRDWRVVYEKNAVSHTIVPSTFRAFVIQQTRWKRSWTRESVLVATFIWRKHPIAAFFTYLSIVLPLLAPVAALHAIVWGPIAHGGTLPLVYIAGIYSLAMVYSLYYVLFQDEYSLVWVYGVLFVFFYLGIMLWQTYYAIATCRTAQWGTRPATAGVGAGASR